MTSSLGPNWSVDVNFQAVLASCFSSITACPQKTLSVAEQIPSRPQEINKPAVIVPWMQKSGYFVASTTALLEDLAILPVSSGAGARKRLSPSGGSAYGIPR